MSYEKNGNIRSTLGCRGHLEVIESRERIVREQVAPSAATYAAERAKLHMLSGRRRVLEELVADRTSELGDLGAKCAQSASAVEEAAGDRSGSTQLANAR